MQIIHMDPMEPIDPILPSGSYTFKHFDTVQECDHYILNNTRLSVAYTCCGGKGIAIPIKNPPTRMLIHEQIHTKGTCDICFMEDKCLYSTCNCCKQPFCLDCLRKLPSKICPYCRGSLNLKELNL
jgi:hypothetical protein